MVALRCESTEVAVFEGKVRAEQTLAASQAVDIASGESFTVGEREPPVIKALVKPADAVQWVLYYPPLSETTARPDQACESGSASQKSLCLTARAERRLRAGRVDEAQRDIDNATTLLPNNADADALSSVISVVKNDKTRALELAQRATQLEPLNPRAWIALSYAQQASFKLEDALASAERSAELAPRSATAQARVAELLMSLGKIRSAERAAQAAVDADPNESPRAHDPGIRPSRADRHQESARRFQCGDQARLERSAGSAGVGTGHHSRREVEGGTRLGRRSRWHSIQPIR